MAAPATKITFTGAVQVKELRIVPQVAPVAVLAYAWLPDISMGHVTFSNWSRKSQLLLEELKASIQQDYVDYLNDLENSHQIQRGQFLKEIEKDGLEPT